MHDLARGLLTALCCSQGLLMLVVELNRTHATHARWPGHARFHLVWQNVTNALFAAFASGLIWWPGPWRRGRFFLAAGVAGIPLLGFTAAWALRRLYGGTLADAEGVRPLRVRAGARAWEIDGNVAAVGVGSVVLLVAVGLVWWGG